MVNDLLRELYTDIKVPHMVCSPVGVLTIDKYLLSEVIDFESQIMESRPKRRSQRRRKPLDLASENAKWILSLTSRPIPALTRASSS